MLSLTSTVVSRIMLSIRSLAAELTSNPSPPSVPLNSTELSRVRWRKGSHAGDILVDVHTGREHDRKVDAVGIGMQIRYEGTYERLECDGGPSLV